MASIMDLLKSRKKEIYGNGGLIYLESRGTINPARAIALAASSPDAAADMIGNIAAGAVIAEAGLVNTGAKRPDDTIFKGKGIFNKPISLAAPTQAELKNAVEPGKAYFVKTTPNPGSNLYNNIKNTIKNPGGAQSLAITALNKFGSKNGIKDLKKFRNQLRNPAESDTYGPEFSYGGNDARKPKEEDKKYSTHYRDFDDEGKLKKRQQPIVSYRNGSGSGDKYPVVNSPWDTINKEILTYITEERDTDDEIGKFEKKTDQLNIPYVLLTHYKKNNKNILLPGTISGISEDYAPEVSSFKFVGSPFNLYRYGGVERTLKFDLKLYWGDEHERFTMLNNLNRLRELVYPDQNITAIEYPPSATGQKVNSPLAFNPNLVYLTISGLYSKLLAIVDSLSISIDDSVSWGTVFFNGDGTTQEKAHPTIYNVSLGFKIIENPQVESGDGGYVYQYNNYFTGYNDKLQPKA